MSMLAWHRVYLLFQQDPPHGLAKLLKNKLEPKPVVVVEYTKLVPVGFTSIMRPPAALENWLVLPVQVLESPMKPRLGRVFTALLPPSPLGRV
jgi:hypothetical protein